VVELPDAKTEYYFLKVFSDTYMADSSVVEILVRSPQERREARSAKGSMNHSGPFTQSPQDLHQNLMPGVSARSRNQKHIFY
jgi:hypothetical protein